MVDETRAEYFILAETDAEILDQVRAVLRRIELGIYGICVVDGCPAAQCGTMDPILPQAPTDARGGSRDSHPDALATGAGLRR
jgi:hypothetical protein